MEKFGFFEFELVFNDFGHIFHKKLSSRHNIFSIFSWRQIFFPQQTITQTQSKKENILNQESQDLTSIDQNQNNDPTAIKTRQEIINDSKVGTNNSERIIIQNDKLDGTINLTGGIIDDLILTKYKETLDLDSKNIQLFSPNNTKNPYYLDIGWKELKNEGNNIDLPNKKTKWEILQK